MENSSQDQHLNHSFSDLEREALYQTIFSRRDVRGQYTSRQVPEDVLSRVLMAAHYAPSVGFMQPWSFIIVRSDETKRKVHGLFARAHAEAADMFEGDKREIYRGLKLEGILESPINICVTCDKDRAGPVVVGRTHVQAMDVYSSVCAVQNLWLAARAEGLGLGWVSIYSQKNLKEVLDIPRRVVPIAYLCLGYVSQFFDKPELQSANWRPRLPISELVHFERFNEGSDDPYAAGLFDHLRTGQKTIEDGAFAERNGGVRSSGGPQAFLNSA